MLLHEDFRVLNYKNSSHVLKDIQEFIASLEQDFIPPLSQRVDLYSYAKKLICQSDIIIIQNKADKSIAAMIAFYCSPKEYDVASISFLGVAPKARGKGLGPVLLFHCKQLVRQAGMKAIETRTWETNEIALNMYKKQGFIVVDRIFNIEEKRFDLKISLTFNENMENDQ